MQRALFGVITVIYSHFTLAQAPVCAAKEYRQFDFWQGKWRVEAQGKVAGTNTITPSLNGCTLHEHYVTAGGYEGNSYNIYDRQQNRWHQTWVDNSGLLLQLDGAWDGRSMVLSGAGTGPNGEPITHRITWTPNENGTVRQHWQVSADKGTTWTTAFDGLYHRIAETQ